MVFFFSWSLFLSAVYTRCLLCFLQLFYSGKFIYLVGINSYSRFFLIYLFDLYSGWVLPLTHSVFQLFFSYFKDLVGREVTVELKNDLAIRGTLHSVDQYLNIKLENTRVVDEDKYPHMVINPCSPPIVWVGWDNWHLGFILFMSYGVFFYLCSSCFQSSISSVKICGHAFHFVLSFTFSLCVRLVENLWLALSHSLNWRTCELVLFGFVMH